MRHDMEPSSPERSMLSFQGSAATNPSSGGMHLAWDITEDLLVGAHMRIEGRG
jgi:hypothetical protein